MPGTGSDTETGSTQPGSTGPAPPSSVFAMASGAPRSSLQLEEAASPVRSPDGEYQQNPDIVFITGLQHAAFQTRM